MNGWLLIGGGAWLALGAVAILIGRASKREPPTMPEPRPPGYGERYHYRGFLDPDPQDFQPDCGLLGPEIPDDEPGDVATAFYRFTRCSVCRFRRRVCSSAACPQRKEL